MKSLFLRILSEKLRFSCFSQVSGSDYPEFRPILPKIFYILIFYSPIIYSYQVANILFCPAEEYSQSCEKYRTSIVPLQIAKLMAKPPASSHPDLR